MAEVAGMSEVELYNCLNTQTGESYPSGLKGPIQDVQMVEGWRKRLCTQKIR